MMVDNTDDKIFQDLLSDYAQPIADAGFSEALLRQLPARTPRKSYVVGGAAIVGGALALRQVPTLFGYFSDLKLPTIKMPVVSIPAVDTAPLHSAVQSVPSSVLMAAGFAALLLLGLGGAALLGEDI